MSAGVSTPRLHSSGCGLTNLRGSPLVPYLACAATKTMAMRCTWARMGDQKVDTRSTNAIWIRCTVADRARGCSYRQWHAAGSMQCWFGDQLTHIWSKVMSGFVRNFSSCSRIAFGYGHRHCTANTNRCRPECASRRCWQICWRGGSEACASVTSMLTSNFFWTGRTQELCQYFSASMYAGRWHSERSSLFSSLLNVDFHLLSRRACRGKSNTALVSW